MFFVVRSNDSFNFPLGWIKYKYCYCLHIYIMLYSLSLSLSLSLSYNHFPPLQIRLKGKRMCALQDPIYHVNFVTEVRGGSIMTLDKILGKIKKLTVSRDSCPWQGLKNKQTQRQRKSMLAAMAGVAALVYSRSAPSPAPLPHVHFTQKRQARLTQVICRQ